MDTFDFSCSIASMLRIWFISIWNYSIPPFHPLSSHQIHICGTYSNQLHIFCIYFFRLVSVFPSRCSFYIYTTHIKFLCTTIRFRFELSWGFCMSSVLFLNFFFFFGVFTSPSLPFVCLLTKQQHDDFEGTDFLPYSIVSNQF